MGGKCVGGFQTKKGWGGGGRGGVTWSKGMHRYRKYDSRGIEDLGLRNKEGGKNGKREKANDY